MLMTQEKQTLVIGLTGGIACGKSVVTQILHKKGVPIIDADKIAKKIVQPKQPALISIVKLFGKEILNNDGSLDRKALRLKVFNDQEKLSQLEAILHPKIREEIQKEIIEKTSTYPYIVVDIPLLVEKNYQALFDQIWVVDCLPEQQIERAMMRDNTSKKQIENIIATQVNRQQRLAIADKVLDNTGSLDKLRLQVDEYHNKLMSIA